MTQIERISKTKVADLSKLKLKKYRHERQLLILEGKRVAQQLLSYGILPIEQYLANPDSAITREIPTYLCTPEELRKICDSEHPAGIAGLYPVPVASSSDFHRALYLDRISDPGNLGTVFRTAAAFAIEHIFLSPGSCEVANPKVIRASMGAAYRVSWGTLSAGQLMELPARKIVLDAAGESSLAEHQPDSRPEIYILGSEAHGVDPELMAISDTTLRIPMPGKMESLNLAISAAILCYQISCC